MKTSISVPSMSAASMSATGRRHFMPLVGVLILLACLPSVADSYYLGVAAKMMIFALFASSLNLILGYAGLASLGHAAFFGMGAYAAAKLGLGGFSGFWTQWLFAGGCAVLLAALFCLLTLRAKGSYLLMITLALAQVLWGIAYSWRDFTGADDGLPGIRRPQSGWFWNLDGDLGFYYFVLAIFALAMVAMTVLVCSPFGRALVGIRENERRMSVLGYNVWLYKYVACLLAGLLAGWAGTMLAWQNGFVGPSYLSITYSAAVLIMVILGGAGTVMGSVVGAFLIVGLENVVSAWTERWVMVLGGIYVAVTLFAPEGMTGLVARLRKGKA